MSNIIYIIVPKIINILQSEDFFCIMLNVYIIAAIPGRMSKNSLYDYIVLVIRDAINKTTTEEGICLFFSLNTKVIIVCTANIIPDNDHVCRNAKFKISNTFEIISNLSKRLILLHCSESTANIVQKMPAI